MPEKFRLDIRNNYFIERVVKDCEFQTDPSLHNKLIILV